MHPTCVLGFADEPWWSRLAQPACHNWIDPHHSRRLVEQTVPSTDPDPKAFACYGRPRTDLGRVWLRFVHGRPSGTITTQFLARCLTRLAQDGKTALLLVWDNASWHMSAEVRSWMRHHNRQVKHRGSGVRLISCSLLIKSPWLNNIEPHWVHGKRTVADAERLLKARELADRVCAHFQGCHEQHLAIPDNVA